MLDWIAWVWEKANQNSGLLGLIAAILALFEYFFMPVRWLWNRLWLSSSADSENSTAASSSVPLSPPTGTVQMDLATFEAIQQRALTLARNQMEASHGKEREQLQQTIEALQERLRNPEEALAQQHAIIIDLERKLANQSNGIEKKERENAFKALEGGDFTKARALFEGIASQTAKGVLAHAEAEFALGQIAEAEVRWQEAYAHYKQAFKLNESAENLRAIVRMGWRLRLHDEAISFQKVLTNAARTTHGSTSNEYAAELNNLATLLRADGQSIKARGLFSLISLIGISKGTDSEQDHVQLSNLAGTLEDQGQFSEAEKLYRKAVEIGEEKVGRNSAEFAVLLNNLAGSLRKQGQNEDAENLYIQAIEITGETLGKDHPAYATRLNNLATTIRALGRLTEAETLYRQALEVNRRALGERHPEYGVHLGNLASIIEAQGRHREAEGVYNQALDTLLESLGSKHPSTQIIAMNFWDLINAHLPKSAYRDKVEALLPKK